MDVATGLCAGFGARMMVGLGAYPFAAPHTRPSRLSVSCGSDEVAATVPYLKNSVDVPAGVQAALEHGFTARGIPALGLWAQVPHYVSASAYPQASMALLGGLHEVAGLDVEAGLLREESERHGHRLDELIASNGEHLAVLHQLEQAYDEEAAAGGLSGRPRCRSPTTTSRAATSWPPSWSASCASRAASATGKAAVRAQYGQVSPSWPSRRATEPRRATSSTLMSTLRANQPSSRSCRPTLRGHSLAGAGPPAGSGSSDPSRPR